MKFFPQIPNIYLQKYVRCMSDVRCMRFHLFYPGDLVTRMGEREIRSICIRETPG